MATVALPQRRVEADAVVDDAHVQLRVLGQLDADALRLPVTRRVRHRLPDDPQHGLARRRGQLQARVSRTPGPWPPDPGRLLGDAHERFGQRLVGRAHERGDHAARLVECAAPRGPDVAHSLRGTVAPGQLAGLLHDERQVLRHAVVDVAREPLALVEHGRLLKLSLRDTDLLHAADQQRDEEPSRSTSPA